MYDPSSSTPGEKLPLDALPSGAVHVPPASGDPFSPEINAVVALDEQSVRPPSMPASGMAFTVTVTEEMSAGHGVLPGTV